MFIEWSATRYKGQDLIGSFHHENVVVSCRNEDDVVLIEKVLFDQLTHTSPSSMLVVNRFFAGIMGVTLLYFCALKQADGMSANPIPFRERQPTGDLTPQLFLRGNPKFHYMTDSNGFTVMQNENKTFVFAAVDERGASLVPTDMVVGATNPFEINMMPNTLPNSTMQAALCGRLCEVNEAPVTSSTLLNANTTTVVTGGAATRKNLVILVRFADHANRKLPPVSDFNELFDNVLQGSAIAPAGGVRQYLRMNSYGSLDLESVVYGWINLPETEAYYADGQSGLSDAFPRALFHALDAIDAADFPWSDLDQNGDGLIDSLTLMHSGYAAEWGQTDSNGQAMSNRIWSHHWTLPRSRRWKSSSGLQVDKYIACPGLWDTQGSEIGHVGVIVHELGHSLGLPDLYGSGNMQEDNGIGSYGVMGNSWGFDNTQMYPPHMCPWSKMVLGWSRPFLISRGGVFDVEPSASIDQVYRIDLGPSEYLLIENRQPLAFDAKLPTGGLAIWHIDEAATNVIPGFPNQGGWPQNGKHYKVALLQADGKYDLEQAINSGDSGDLFYAGGQSRLGPSFKGGNYPNTDAYQGGLIKQSGITIESISASSNRMKFTVLFKQKPLSSPAPSPIPTRRVPSSTKELVAGFQGGSGGAGCMFDVVAMKDLVLTEVQIHTYATTFVDVEVWSRLGTFQGNDNDRSRWELVKTERVLGKGAGKGTRIRVPNVEMRAQKPRSFYITAANGGSLAYSKGSAVGTVYASNGDLHIMEGVSKAYQFGATFPNRRWNGALRYEIGIRAPPPASITRLPITPSVTQTESPTVNPWLRENSLTTTWDGGTAQDGNMFDIMPLKTMTITGFDLHISFTGEVIVEIYTKADSFRGHETVYSDWTMIARIALMGKGEGSITPIPPNSFAPIHSERFQIRSFYITVVSSQSGGLTYTRGDGSGSPIGQDDNLVVFQGVGIRYPCLSAFPGRIWNGAIEYIVVQQPLEIKTNFFGGNQASGNMFDVVASKAISIVGLEVHVASKSELLLEVFIKAGSYIGHESRRDSWSRIANVTTMGRGTGKRTYVPANAFKPVLVGGGSSVAFYVTIKSRDMRYSRGVEFSDAASNDDMTVTKGIGKDYPFGLSYLDRVWNGVLRYNIV